jgi:formate hydrogenlyase transcriptional activator
MLSLDAHRVRKLPASGDIPMLDLPISPDPLGWLANAASVVEANAGAIAQWQLAFERLLTDLAASFVNVSGEDVGAQIQRGLKEISEFVDVDQTTLMEFSPDGSQLRRTHWYARAGIVPGPGIVANEQFPWYTSQVRQGITLALGRLPDDLPAEATAARRYCVEQGLKSHLTIPLTVHGVVAAAISLGVFSRFVEWPEALISRLRLAGRVFAGALARQRADDALQASEQRFRTMADFCYDWDYWLGPDGRVIYVSPSCERITGYRPEEFVADPGLLLRIVHPEDRAGWEAHLRVEPTMGPDAIDLRIVTRGGEVRWIGHLCQAVFGSGGEYLGHRVSNRDITERKRSQLALEQAHREVQQLQQRLQHENLYLRAQAQPAALLSGIVGSSPALRQVLKQVEQVAKTNTTVLITGESGTGKEIVASAIHELSHRRDRVLVRVNCAALAPMLIESELFGREKGAYTGALTRQIGRFELADGATIFLDEVGELPLELQAKLLRVLEQRTFERLGSPKTICVDARVIAASNRDLPGAIREGRFREELFYRLNVFPICVPPLRERPGDVPDLVWAFVAEFGKSLGKTIDTIPQTTMESLQRYHWPGNVRELRNLIERAVIVCEGSTLQIQLPAATAAPRKPARTLEEVEREYIRDVLDQTHWRIRGSGGAAEILGMKPTTLESRMANLGIYRRNPASGIS